MKHNLYIGNGACCYANSTSMLLASVEEKILPSIIEVLTGIGLGASFGGGFLYFSHPNLMPDLGISKALEILGFESTSKSKENSNEFSVAIGELNEVLENSPAILGPLDVGDLTYNPRHKYSRGVDHFVLAYKIEEENIYLHDPAGFPNVFLSFKDLKKSWKAEGIFYRQGYYRYITHPKRVRKVSDSEIYKNAIRFFKKIYQTQEENKLKPDKPVGVRAILEISRKALNSNLSKEEIEHFVHFALPLGSKRALDFASFFEKRNNVLSVLKKKQAELFGASHVFTLKKDWNDLSHSLEKIADIEDKFEKIILKA